MIEKKILNCEQLKNAERFKNIPLLSDDKIKNAAAFALKKVDAMICEFDEKYPSASSDHGKYRKTENRDWTEGFWSGMLWLAYEITGDKKYYDVACRQIDDYEYRLKNNIVMDIHDIGFLYSLSCVAGYKVTGDERMRSIAVQAAEKLCELYREKGEFIQAFGRADDPSQYKFIMDCLMNLPFLYWASETTGNQKYAEIAEKHLNTAIKYCIRSDGSSYQHFYMDIETGEPIGGKTNQGHRDESCWSRGEAWGVYGLPLSYRYLKNETLLDIHQAVTNYFLNRLPKDFVPYWDFDFEDGSGEPKDSSAAAIAVCGLNEAVLNMPYDDDCKDMYRYAENAILTSLIDHYISKDDPDVEGLLRHVCYHAPAGLGIDECMTCGDYFFMEALYRKINPKWICYW